MSSPATSAQLKPDAPFSLDLLAAAVRPEFAVECYFPDPDDPVLGGGRCAVASCSRLSWGRGLCGSHYDRWHRAGKPDLTEWLQAATRSPQEQGCERPSASTSGRSVSGRVSNSPTRSSPVTTPAVSARAARRWPGP